MLHPTRRQMLIGGAASLGCWLTMPQSLSAVTRPARTLSGRRPVEEDDFTFVMIELHGGNDGLSTVVPKGDDLYHAARDTTRHAPETLLSLDDYRGLHPALTGMHALWNEGHLGIVEGVGYPDPNRSHFTSMDIWGTASPKGKLAGDGWVGNLLREKYGDNTLPTRVVHIGEQMPYSLQSSGHPVLCMETPAGYRWAQGAQTMARLLDDSGAEESTHGRLAALMDNARASSRQVRKAVEVYNTSVEYPADPLAQSLKVCAALIDGRIGSRILSVRLPGFDHHVEQRELHDELMLTLDGALTAFMADIRRSGLGRKTIVMVYSEFGRRLQENASGGTDHGKAAPTFLLGDPVRGGLYGKHPSLAELDDGDLIHNTDFRRIYASLLRDAFGVAPERILPGTFEPLPLLKA